MKYTKHDTITLKGNKYKILIIIDYNHFCHFINIKSLSFK